ncbi:hypothetical protein ACIBBD_01980 [Streptomyces sp. NPDC051315]|uniref:hypothetical protein n=1 Tax=Streptomyces sp. NPDC051315 TaxID=3365650 RepID=UPI00378F2FDF
MAKPLVVFKDTQAAGAGLLRTALTGRSEPFAAGVSVGTRVPTVRSPEDPLLPFVLVRKDGDSPHSSMAMSRVLLRVTVWHADADQAHDLAMLCQGLLICHDGSVLSAIRPNGGPLPANDPDSGVDLSTFTVNANVRADVLA